MSIPTVDTTAMDWIPLSPGLWFKPLRFFIDDTGYQLLLRIEPGTVIPPHRHTGEIHAYNLAGHRRSITTGDASELRCRPDCSNRAPSNQGASGSVIPERPLTTATSSSPPKIGNHDTWEAIGDEDCIVHLEANGRVEYLDGDGNLIRHTDATTARNDYLAHCNATNTGPLPALA